MTIAEDGSSVLYLRSLAGDDPVHHLWRLDVASGNETQLADATLLGLSHDLPTSERRRRERLREGGGGITGYATDRAGDVAIFALGGEVFAADVRDGTVGQVRAPAGAFDPRPSPNESHVAYVVNGALWVTPMGGSARQLVHEDGVTWGLAEFVAAEEMGRQRGFWWGPESDRLVVARVDESAVETWHIAEPARPEQASTPHRYPAAGTANAEVRLFIIGLDGQRVEIDWDRAAYEYVAAVHWSTASPSLLVQSRDQRAALLLAVDPDTGTVEVDHELRDDHWVELVAGTPSRLEDGRSVLVAPVDGQQRLLIGGTAVTEGINVSSVESTDGNRVLLAANDLDEPTKDDLWMWSAAGLERLTSSDGVHAGHLRGDVLVVSRSSIDGEPTVTVHVEGQAIAIPAMAEEATVVPEVLFSKVTERELPAGLVLPGPSSPHVEADRLPVILDPYGGPHFGRVRQARHAWLTPQWLADQGFAVVVIDGRGTPGRGPSWERAVAGDLAGPALQDQLDGLDAVASTEPRLDLSRVAIRGWSFGGYLAALAALRRPDRIRAAIIGAPVVDWRLYDTHYTERYLGHPEQTPDAYRASAVVTDDGLPPAADSSSGPALLIIHGLADDNVVAAHSLRLSAALLAAGRPHEFLPLSGVTHMTPQAVIAENLLLHQVSFLRRHLDDTG